MYNCARLATLIKEFDKKVLATVYPPLPPIEDIQFNLLSEPVCLHTIYNNNFKIDILGGMGIALCVHSTVSAHN